MLLHVLFPTASRNIRMDVHMMIILAVAIFTSLAMPERPYGDVITTDLEPSGSLYKAAGKRLDITCSYKDNTSDSLLIERCNAHRNCTPLPSETLNNTSIRTSIRSLQLQDTGTYTCDFPPHPSTMSILFLRVGYQPSPPKDIYCFSKDHLDMNCTVTLADRDARSELGHDVTIDFQSDRSTEWVDCLHYDAKSLSCYWKSPAESDSSGMDFLSDFSLLDTYIVRVKVRNILGRSQAILSVNDSTTIVKISELHQFSVTNITSGTASLSWKLPEFLLPGIFMIDFDINYTSRWNQNPKQLLYSTKDRMRTELVGLIPYTTYYVSIRARGQMVTDDRNWSPVESLSFRTHKDAPSAAPRYTIGGYFLPGRGMNNTGDNCALQIYLKPLPGRKRNGNLGEMYYTVYIQGTTDHQRIVRPLTTVTLSDISCWKDGPYIITVQACIEDNLCSDKRTVIHIPSFNQVPDNGLPHASEVIAEGYGDTSIKVSWVRDTQSQTNVENVTVFWCRGNKELNTCKNKLWWKILPGDVTQTTLNLTHSYYRDWMFAVSFTTDQGVSGGMVFDNCQFLYDVTDLEQTTGGKRNPDSTFGSVKPSFNLLTRNDGLQISDVVSLTFRYCDAQFLYRKPDLYEVFYKEVGEKTEEDCTYGARSLNVTATLRVQEIVLPDLDPGSLYVVCMRIWTSVGASDLSDVKWRKPINNPDDALLNSGLFITMTLVAVSSLLFITLLSWCVRHKYKSMDVNVQVPVIETDEHCLMESLRNGYVVKDNGSGSTKGNTTLTTRDESNIVNARRLLPAPPLLPNRQISADSDVVHDSLESQETDGSKDNIYQAIPNGGSDTTSSNMCEFSIIDISKNCRTHANTNNDGIFLSRNSFGSTSNFSADFQHGFTEHIGSDSGTGNSPFRFNMTTSQNSTSIGSYCQWDTIGANDSSVSLHCAKKDNDTTGNSDASDATEYRRIEGTCNHFDFSGVSDATEYRQIGGTSNDTNLSGASERSDLNYNRSGAIIENDVNSPLTSSLRSHSVPGCLVNLCVLANDTFDDLFTEKDNLLLPTDSTRADVANIGAVTNCRCLEPDKDPFVTNLKQETDMSVRNFEVELNTDTSVRHLEPNSSVSCLEPEEYISISHLEPPDTD